MKWGRVLLLLIGVALGCSTTNDSTLPPTSDLLPPEMSSWPINNQLLADRDFVSLDLFLSRVAREHPAPNTYWWADYRRAQLWTKKDRNVACENFSKLASDQTFPLRRLAYLRAHETCPKDNQILERLEPFVLENFEGPMQSIALEVAIQKSRASKDKRALMDLLIKKSKMNLRREEKVDYTIEALSLARKLGDQQQIRAMTQRLHNLSPSRNQKPKVQDYLTVASDFRYRRHFDSARKYYRKVLKRKASSVSEKLQAYKGLRASYKLQQRRKEAVAVTEELANYVLRLYKRSKKRAHDVRLYQDTELLLVRTLWTENFIKKAEKILTRAEKNLKGKGSLAEIYWIRGRMFEERQNFAEAVAWLRKAVSESGDSVTFQEKIKWYLAWNERKLHHYDVAAEIFKELKEKTENTYDRNRFQFWFAKTLANQGESKKSQKEYKELTEEDPLSYYGLLSHREVGKSLPLDRFRRDQKKNNPLEYKPTRLLRQQVDEVYFDWLVAVREDDVARFYLDQVADVILKEKAEDLDSFTQLMRLYGRSHNYLPMFAQLNRLSAPLRRTIFETNPELIFPRPYSETVSRSAARFGISVEFIYSVMRQESSFNPQARSHMDAYGLMQLLPEVAKRSAAANSIDYANPDDLYEPYINIPLGSAHLRELWDKYNGEFVLAVASYNASENAILTWLKTRYRGDTLEFIEDIPYDETRDYVKLVMRNLINYQMLQAQVEELTFPEWTLRISHQPPKK